MSNNYYPLQAPFTSARLEIVMFHNEWELLGKEAEALIAQLEEKSK